MIRWCWYSTANVTYTESQCYFQLSPGGGGGEGGIPKSLPQKNTLKYKKKTFKKCIEFTPRYLSIPQNLESRINTDWVR